MIILEKEHYHKLSSYLKRVSFNHLFARAVIENDVSGKVYVDNRDAPGTFYIVHRYGMSLLGGDWTNLKFNSAFKQYALNHNHERKDHEWMQVFPDDWNSVMRDLFKDTLIKAEDNSENKTQSIIELNSRVNFRFDKATYYANQKMVNDNSGIEVVKSSEQVFKMEGSVVPRLFWNSVEDFESRGVGFGVFVEGRLAAAAFSSVLAPGKLELGIETAINFRGRGFAEAVCRALIDYCIDRNLEPIWACRLQNTGSYRLAKKLGFIPSLELPYYKLPS